MQPLDPRVVNSASNAAVQAQAIASLVRHEKVVRMALEAAKLDATKTALSKACNELENVRGFLGAPQHILGSDATKHGQIAEVLEVAIRNARSLMAFAAPNASMPANPLLPYDILINAQKVQLKTCNGANQSLNHVLGHMRDYTYFARDDSYYLIPRDQYVTVLRVLNNDTGGLGNSTVAAVSAKVREVEALTGKPFEQVVLPSSATYAQVQRGAVHKTLNELQAELEAENDTRESGIRAEHAPSVAGGLKTAGVAAGAAATLTLAAKLATKYVAEGKNVFKGELTQTDWKEVGLDTVKASGVACLSSAAVYGLSNWAGVAAPVAGAFAAASRAVAVLVSEYHSGAIDADTLVDQALFVCSEVTVVSVFSVAGQIAVPVPVVGALLGSVTGKYASALLVKLPEHVTRQLQERLDAQLEFLNVQHRQELDALLLQFAPIVDMTEFAFSAQANAACLRASAELAQAWGVPENKILRDKSEVLAFLASP